MYSPAFKKSTHKFPGSNEASTTGNNDDESCADQQYGCVHSKRILEEYFCFKRKLLQAMQEADPLEILESGIFQEFEAFMASPGSPHDESRSIQPRTKQELAISKPLQLTDFQTVFQTYQISHDLKITQLQRRSRSCSPRQRQKQLNWSKLQMKSVQYVLWRNALREIKAIHGPSTSRQEQVKEDHEMEQMQQQARILQQKIAENQQLKSKLIEIQSKYQNKKEVSPLNSEDDYRLEYLLKQKQLIKKLQEAKDEMEKLRSLLQKNTQQLSTPHIFRQESQLLPANTLFHLREKIENEARVKKALQLVWGQELKNECSLPQVCGPM